MAASNGQMSNGDAPEGLTDLSGGSWREALKRTVKAFREDKLTDWAAALTYFGVLAIFPALLVVVSVLGLIGDSVTDSLLKNLEDVAPGPAHEILTNAIREPAGRGECLGCCLGDRPGGRHLGLVGLRQRLHERVQLDLRRRRRRLTKTLPVRLGLTVVLMVLAGLIAFSVTLTGGLAKEVGDVVGGAIRPWTLGGSPSGRSYCSS